MALTNIGIFGRRNVGKSSLINLLTGQDTAIVSDTPGTTTDPVRKRMEILGIGKCNLIDTAGIDDTGDLGEQRVAKTYQAAAQVDVALLLFTANLFSREEVQMLNALREAQVPTIAVHNQSDIVPLDPAVAMDIMHKYAVDVVEFSCARIDDTLRRDETDMLLAYIEKAVAQAAPFRERAMFDGIIPDKPKRGKQHRVLLVCPIDSEAPAGRLILPQTMAIRDILDRGAVATVLQPAALRKYLRENPVPDLVVTDSQVFGEVSGILPKKVPLTSFSVLLARSRSCYPNYLEGTPKISRLQDGDRVLILESCTHHSSCEDIGRVKLPALFRKFTGKQLEFDIVSGLDQITRPVEEYALIAQCGGCMITSKQLYNRLKPAITKGIPVTNYGMAIAYMKGVKLSADGIG